MPRYFLEVAYKGTRYSGFQIQQNATTIQSEVENALHTLHRTQITLTGSSRTDAGVHARQNFFHFDFDSLHPQSLYKLNAILPDDVVIKQIQQMHDDAHCRFDAISRRYEYHIYRFKNPFLRELAYYYPFALNVDTMHEAASFIKTQNHFQTFSKAHTQVANYNCNIGHSAWTFEKDAMVYTVEANRFLRGMVRMLTASMLRVGRGQLTIDDFKNYFTQSNRCPFSAPAHGLYLAQVTYPPNHVS